MSGASDDAELRIICGPTGAGKSAVALALAERVGARILSVDSRQIYRGFDIGTAKPSAADRARVAHDGIDIADPSERWSAARFAEYAHASLASAERPMVIVGGTGLWLRALVTPLFSEPPLDAPRRTALADALDARSTEELRRWVQQLDPARASLGRTQLLRAIEIALLTGQRISALHAASAAAARPARWLVVDPGVRLAAQIESRLDAMLAAGWLEEVRSLAARVPEDAPAWKASGYARLRAGGDARAVRDAILIETRQYAKRQRTWFRHQLAEAQVTRVDPYDPDCAGIVHRWWTGEGTA
ncbi:MAG: tRNA (adenosine(37)-N6)-dimethylallyltransferase MiaA [Gemmatimonadaceae bacterium]|nr:tRNA (adenosine(37)-N6)-dimethylallyltransferase MiaA [Gemmatimonadaceae bacterium]